MKRVLQQSAKGVIIRQCLSSASNGGALTIQNKYAERAARRVEGDALREQSTPSPARSPRRQAPQTMQVWFGRQG